MDLSARQLALVVSAVHKDSDRKRREIKQYKSMSNVGNYTDARANGKVLQAMNTELIALEDARTILTKQLRQSTCPNFQ